jgi:hypothetical protein
MEQEQRQSSGGINPPSFFFKVKTIKLELSFKYKVYRRKRNHNWQIYHNPIKAQK